MRRIGIYKDFKIMQINPVVTAKRFLKIVDVISLMAKSRNSIYLGVSVNIFPKPYKIGERAVAWLASDIDAWIDAQNAKVGGLNHGQLR